MRHVFFAKRLMKTLKNNGVETFTIDDLTANKIHCPSYYLTAAKMSGLIKKKKYNSTTKIQTWAIL